MVKSTLRRLLGRMPKQWQGWMAQRGPCHQRAYGQFGEDLLLDRYLQEPTGFYVDIGAFHPKYRSNTHQLWRRGWRGINVDVDDYKVAQFRRFRPNDINLVAGVSSESGERQFYFQSQESYGSMSSLDQDFAIDRAEKMKRPVESRTISVSTLNDLLGKHLPFDKHGETVAVDLINLDVEGHEFEILRTFDFARFHPRCLCIEIHAATLAQLHDNPTFQLLSQQGYNLVAWPAPSCLFLRSDAAAGLATKAA